MDVLKGAKLIIERDKPDIFVECSEKSRLDDLNELLGPYGYTYVSILASTPVYHFTCREEIKRSYRLIRPEVRRILSRIKQKIKRLFYSYTS